MKQMSTRWTHANTNNARSVCERKKARTRTDKYDFIHAHDISQSHLENDFEIQEYPGVQQHCCAIEVRTSRFVTMPIRLVADSDSTVDLGQLWYRTFQDIKRDNMKQMSIRWTHANTSNARSVCERKKARTRTDKYEIIHAHDISQSHLHKNTDHQQRTSLHKYCRCALHLGNARDHGQRCPAMIQNLW